MTTVRRAGTVSAATLFGLALAIGGAQSTGLDWTRRLGLDTWNLPGLMASARAARLEADDLQNQEEQLWEGIEAADHLTQRLAVGSVSLEAAAAELEPLLLRRNGFEAASKSYFQVPTIRLATARYLIARITRMGNVSEPGQWEAILARLEGEYAKMK